MNKTFRYRIDEISFCILVTLITSFAIIALIMSNYDRLNVAQIYQIWWVNNSGTPGGHDDISWWAFMLRSCCDVNTFYSYWTMNERNDLILVPYIISRIIYKCHDFSKYYYSVYICIFRIRMASWIYHKFATNSGNSLFLFHIPFSIHDYKLRCITFLKWYRNTILFQNIQYDRFLNICWIFPSKYIVPKYAKIFIFL